MANETSYTIDIDVPAGSVEAAAAAVDSLADRLTQAQSVSSAMAARVKDGEAAYKQAEAAANSAAKALERINGQMATASGDRLTNLTMRQIEAAQKAYQTAEALKVEAAALDKLKAAASGAADQQKNIAKQLDAAKAAADKAAKAQEAAAGTGKANEIAEGLGKLGGPLGVVGQKAFGAVDAFKKLSSSLGSLGPYVAAAAVIIALTAAIVAATAAAVVWSVKLADAARSQQLLSDGIAGSVAGGRELDAAIKDLEKRVPQTSDELRAMAADLAKTGLKGQALTDALEASATKAAKLKWGPDFAKGAISLDKLITRLKSNISGVFGALNIEKILQGLSSLVDLFDDTNASGNAMKTLFMSVMQPLIDAIASFIPKMRSAFIQFEILVMKAAIAIKPYGSKLAMVGDLMKEIGIVAAISFGILLASIAAVVVVVVACAVGLQWLLGKIAEGVTAVWAFATSLRDGLVANFNAVIAKVTAVVEMLRGMSLAEIGHMLIEGLANGITAAGAKVLEAIKGVVTGAINAAKGLLGISSPSKVFAEIGQNTAAGMAGGVEGGTGMVQSALETMASPADAASAAAAPASSEGGSGANFAGAAFNFYGVEGAEDAQGRFAELVTKLIEGDYTQLGLAVPG